MNRNKYSSFGVRAIARKRRPGSVAAGDYSSANPFHAPVQTTWHRSHLGFGTWPVVFLLVSVPLFAAWHVGASFAQNGSNYVYDQAIGQPTVTTAVYSSSTSVVSESSGVISNGVAYSPYSGLPVSAVSASYSMAAAAPSFSSSVVNSSIGTSMASTRNWAIDIANAQLALDASRFPSIETSRSKLELAMRNLENFLATSPAHQADWLNFLTWNQLNEELRKANPDQFALTQIEKTFRQNYLGLEMKQFTDVRDALKNYVQALRFGSDSAKSIEILNNRLKKLSEEIQTPGYEKNFSSIRDIGLTLAYLTQARQSPLLVSAVRSNFSKANARVLVSSEFVHRKFGRPVNEANPVDEVILGTQLYGQSFLRGWVIPQLLDSSTNAAIRLNLSGDFTSQNIGYNRSVKLHTQGFAQVAASETIAITENGLVQLNDTGVDADLTSQIDSIEAKLKIVRRIASRQAAKQKPLADAIGEGRLENRIRDQFHSQLSQQLSQANAKLKTPDLPVLNRLGLIRPKRTTWSSPNFLAMLWKLQDADQLAAPTSCPLVVQPSGITVQLHESVITNLTDPVLSGRVIKSTEMDAMAEQFGGVLGTKKNPANTEEPWSITMENYHPVEVELDNSLITFRIRTTKLTKLDRSNQELEQPASVEASYAVQLINGAIQLERQGDVKINFSGRQQGGVRATSLRSFLRKRFDEVFKQQLLDSPIRVLDNLPEELRGLELASIDIDDGWIQANLR